ncbi:MAG: BTAD domain-containing putative transcriptional regulator [Gemmatimonadaceae bacterium]
MMIQLRTLGGTGLRRGDGVELLPVLAQPKRLALLVHLALATESGFRRRDSLVALFWPELDDGHARGALRQALRFLRRELGDGVIVTRGDEEVGTDRTALWCDAVAFEDARSSDPLLALELYRGDLLPGFHVDDAAPELERWLEDTRAELRRHAMALVWELAVARRAAGAREEARSLARRAASLAPDDEAQLGRLLQFLDEMGDRAGALATYDEFAHRLHEDHGAEPAPETQALVGAIRARTTAAPAELPRREDMAPSVRSTVAPGAARKQRFSKWVAATVLAVTGVGGSVIVRNVAAPTSVEGASTETQRRLARDLYARGRYWWNKRGPGLLTSIGFFNKALDADPTFALAYAGLGDAYVQLGYGSLLRPDDAFPKARAAAERALQLDSTLAEPHATLGYVKLYYEWNWSGAEREFRRALALDPAYATGHEWYGLYLAAMGRVDESIAEERRAQELDPLSTAVAGTSAWVQYYAGRFDAADRELRVALREDPSFALGHFYLGRLNEAKGDLGAALDEYDSTGPLRHWVPMMAARGRVLALSGRGAEARQTLAVMDSMSRHGYVTAYAVALVHAALGESDSAFAWLDRGVEERTHWMVWLNRDPRWHSVRGDARFALLVRRVGLPP